jgi:hypothetical protein
MNPSVEITKKFKTVLTKNNIKVFNIIPSEDQLAYKLVTEGEDHLYTEKVLLELIKLSVKEDTMFSLSVSHVGKIDFIVYEPKSHALATLSSNDISNVSKTLKEHNKFHYENLEDVDVFYIFHTETSPVYSDTIKNLLSLYKKNKTKFYVSTDKTIRNLILVYPKTSVEENSVNRKDLVKKSKAVISKFESARVSKNDKLLCITYAELIDTVSSNYGNDATKAHVIKQFRESIKLAMEDAVHELETNMNYILKEIK